MTQIVEIETSELTHEQLAVIAKHRPIWMADHHPSLMARHRPDWMARHRPDWMAMHRPGWMGEYRPLWMANHHPIWMAYHHPSSIAKHRPDWMKEHRPLWMIKHRPARMVRHYPLLVAEYRPDWMEEHCPNWYWKENQRKEHTMDAKVARPELTDQHFEDAVANVRKALLKRRATKQKGTLVTRHEILGIVCEEYHELIEAVHSGVSSDIYNELVDIAVAAIAGIASYEGHNMQW